MTNWYIPQDFVDCGDDGYMSCHQVLLCQLYSCVLSLDAVLHPSSPNPTDTSDCMRNFAYMRCLVK